MIEEQSKSLVVVDVDHHHVHEGKSFCAHVIDSDMDKSDEINICFITPDTTKYLHTVLLPISSIKYLPVLNPD